MGFFTMEREFESGQSLLLCKDYKCTELKPQSREHKVHIAASPLYPHWAPCFCYFLRRSLP